MRLIYQNLVDDATLAASPAMHYATPVTNLQEQAREKVARTTGLSTQTLDVTLAEPDTISAAVIYRGNFTSSATWRVKVYDTAAMSALLYDSGDSDLAAPKTLGDLDWGVDPLGASLFDGWGYTFAALWFEPVIGGFVRITLDDASNPDGYMEASRLFIGPYHEPVGMPVAGSLALTWYDTSKQSRTDGGTLRTEAGVQYRGLDVAGELMSEEARSALSTLLREYGLRGDIYVSVFPDEGNARERDYQMQAKLVSADPIGMRVYGLTDQALRFEEI